MARNRVRFFGGWGAAVAVLIGVAFVLSRPPDQVVAPSDASSGTGRSPLTLEEQMADAKRRAAEADAALAAEQATHLRQLELMPEYAHLVMVRDDARLRLDSANTPDEKARAKAAYEQAEATLRWMIAGTSGADRVRRAQAATQAAQERVAVLEQSSAQVAERRDQVAAEPQPGPTPPGETR